MIHLRCTHSTEDKEEAAIDEKEREETFKTPLMTGEEARPLLCAKLQTT